LKKPELTHLVIDLLKVRREQKNDTVRGVGWTYTVHEYQIACLPGGEKGSGGDGKGGGSGS